MKAFVLLMMGGSGTRMESDIPKQYIEIEGRPLFSYIAEGLCRSKCVDGVLIVAHKDWTSFVKEKLDDLDLGSLGDKILEVAEGGETRSNSVKNGLIALEKYAAAEDAVLIHDATHPYVDEKGMEEVLKALEDFDGVTLGEYQYDTVYEINDDDIIVSTLNRKHVVAGASPEAFRFGRLLDIYRNTPQEELEKMTSAGAMAIANGIEMKVVPCNTVNLKITYPNDMDVFKKTVKSYFFRDK